MVRMMMDRETIETLTSMPGDIPIIEFTNPEFQEAQHHEICFMKLNTTTTRVAWLTPDNRILGEYDFNNSEFD